jgi:GntR family transcriptional regulator, transcriptional repressor for pyruvate dehydrogenase complex
MASLQDYFTPIKQQKVYNQICEQFIDLVERGEFKPGMKLPSERELARHLGVSRASLREALTVLQMMGMVETISGQGTFVSDKPKTFIKNYLLNAGESPFLILQARKTIEPAIGALAATQCSEAGLQKLNEILGMIDSDHSKSQVLGDAFSEGDRGFHLEIARITENPILITMQEMIHSLMGQELWLALMRRTSLSTPGRWQEAHNEHHGIFEAIQGRESHAAASRIKAHLVRVEIIMTQADLSSGPFEETDTNLIIEPG